MVISGGLWPPYGNSDNLTDVFVIIFGLSKKNKRTTAMALGIPIRFDITRITLFIIGGRLQPSIASDAASAPSLGHLQAIANMID